jgi:hypothetical protein
MKRVLGDQLEVVFQEQRKEKKGRVAKQFYTSHGKHLPFSI